MGEIRFFPKFISLDTFNDHIPLQTVLLPTNSSTENKINLRSQGEMITTAQFIQPNESGIVIFSCIHHRWNLPLSILNW